MVLIIDLLRLILLEEMHQIPSFFGSTGYGIYPKSLVWEDVRSANASAKTAVQTNAFYKQSWGIAGGAGKNMLPPLT
jgi:hypothetical protein